MSRRTWRTAPHDRLGRRGRCLLFFSGLDLVYGGAMFAVWAGWQPPSPTYLWFGEVLNLSIWATVWSIVGLACLFYAYRTEDLPAFVMAVGIKVIWGILSVAGSILSNIPIYWGGIWVGLAGLVWTIAGWPEPDDHGKDGA